MVQTTTMKCLAASWFLFFSLALTNDAHKDPAALVLLAKTTESFKLADLQTLEAQLQAQHDARFSCQRILLDQATGSSLLLLQTHGKNRNIDFWVAQNEAQLLPSSLQRCEWIGVVLVNQTVSALDFLNNVERVTTNLGNGRWTLEYQRMRQRGQGRTKSSSAYTSKSLLLCTAQRIPTPAALDPLQATDRFMILDTGPPRGLFLVKHILTQTVVKSKLQQRWATRPYKYSSAINFAVAEIVIDLLQSLLSKQGGGRSARHRRPILLDPTCGSGTVLGVAVDRGFNVMGWDVNPSCTRGTIDNLQHLLVKYSKEANNNHWQIDTRDSSIPVMVKSEQNDQPLVDCAISNLPWGQNSIQFRNETRNIVANVRQLLRQGAPCAFIAKQDLLFLPELGYQVLGKAYIPPADFVLPQARKKKVLEEQDVVESQRRNACVVIIARAI